MKFSKLLLYIVLLLIIEFVLLYVFLELEDICRYGLSDHYFQFNFNKSLELSLTRLILYQPLVLLSFYFFLKIDDRSRKTLSIALLNLALYVMISLLYALLIDGASEFFTRSFFIFLVVSTFISPFIINRIEWFYKE